MAGFIVYWSKEYLSNMNKGEDSGVISVVYGSHHAKMPSISSIHVGDTVYPVTLAEGTLCVMAKLPVERIELAFDYLIRETGQIHSALVPDGYALEHEYNAGGIYYRTNENKYEDKNDLPKDTIILVPKAMKEKPHQFHQEPQTCCANLAASGTQGSTVFMRPLPLECLPSLRFGPTKIKEMPLKLNTKGVPTTMTLSSTRRMSESTQEQFERLFSGGENEQ